MASTPSSNYATPPGTEPLYTDFLRPIRDDNRDEYFLVDFHRVLVNTNMSLVLNLFERALQDHSIIELFPTLHSYSKLDVNQLYDTTVLYNYPHELIQNLSADRISADLAVAFRDQFMEPYHFDKLHYTRVGFILHEVLQHSFLKKIYLRAPKFTGEMVSYLRNIFGSSEVGSRIVLIEGNLHDSLTDLPQITTVFMSNTSDLIDAYQIDEKLIEGKLFVIMDGYDNFIPDPSDNQKFIYAYTDFFERWKAERRCIATYVYPAAIKKRVPSQ